MKKIITLVLAVLMLTALFTVTAYADDSGTFGEDNALTWTFSAGTLTISGTGAIPDYVSGNATPWSAYNEEIGVIAVKDGVTAIGENAFSSCTVATAVNISATVSTIEENAFSNTKEFTSIYVPCTLKDNKNLPSGLVTSFHDKEEVAEVPATNKEAGTKKYYRCKICKGKFWDAECKTAVEDDTQLVIAVVPLSYRLEGDTLTIDGGTKITDYTSIEKTPWYGWLGSIKNVKIYSGIESVGKNAFQNMVVEKLTIPCTLADNANLPKATATDIIHDSSWAEHHDAKAAGPATEGNLEYWTCTKCNRYFTDSALTNETTWDKLVTPKTDTTAPIPKSIALSQDTVTINYADTNVTVTVLAEDNESGVKDAGYITFYNQSSNEYLKCNLTKGTGIFLTGVMNVYETITPGTYTVQTLTLADNAGNSHEYTYQELVSCGCAKALYIVRSYKITPVLTVSFTTTTVGYGGTLTGKVTLTDSKGYPLTNRTVDVYSGTTKIATVVTGSDGTAEFKYYSSTSGTYYVKATYAGDSYFNTRTSDPVTVTFTTVPATGDTYGVVTWSLVVLTALGINAWVLLRRRRS